MTDHNFTPPPELVQQWEADWHCSGNTNGNGFTYFVATRAAQWGSDQELEACCEWLGEPEHSRRARGASELRAARRSKPQSLKEQALDVLETLFQRSFAVGEAERDTIRRALEQLND